MVSLLDHDKNKKGSNIPFFYGDTMAIQFEKKSDLYKHALSNLAISGITAPMQPEDEETALTVLESLMYEMRDGWNINLNYNFEESPVGASDHGMPFAVFASIASLLALRLCKHYALPATPALMSQANTADVVVSGWNANETLRPVQYPRRMARGSGNTLRWNRWQRYYRSPTRVTPDATTIYINVGEINDFSESFQSYLKAGETIESYIIDSTENIRIVSSSSDGLVINYRVGGIDTSNNSSFGQIKFSVTTTEGRVQERIIDVNITISKIINL